MKGLEIGLITALFVTVFGQVLYHVIAKSVSVDHQPWEVISAAYFFGFIMVFAVGCYLGKISIGGFFSSSNVLAAVPIALAVACVELGYLYAYKNGLLVSVGALSVLAITTIILAPVAWFSFGESIRITKILGVILAILGIWLMQGESKS